LDSIMPLRGLHQQPRQRLQGGDNIVLPPLSNPASRIKGFPPCWWWGNTDSTMTMPPRRKQRPRASPLPASSRAFAPAPPLAPKIIETGRLEPHLAAPPMRRESDLAADEGGALTTVPPPPSVRLDGGGPVRRRRPAGHWHHHVPGGWSCQAPPRPLQTWTQHHMPSRG
jgi:hypothetical protein